MSTVKTDLHRRRSPAEAPLAESDLRPAFDAAFAVPVAGLIHSSLDVQTTDLPPLSPNGRLHRLVDDGRLARLRRSAADPGTSTAAPARDHGVVRRVRVPKATAGKTVLDTDNPDEFIAAITALKKAGKQNDGKIEKVIEWLKTNVPESALITQCQDIWIQSPEELGSAGKPAARQKSPAKKSAAQKRHEKNERELLKKKKQAELDQIAADQAKAAKQAQDAASAKAANDVLAPVYWHNIQAEPGNSGHGGSLKFLVENKYVKVEPPHRCFLSRYERDAHGNRTGNKFGLSVKLTPIPLVVGTGDEPLVIHLHCDSAGKVLSAGIKFLAGERVAGDNILVEKGPAWRDYLQVSGVTGDNVETTVGAFN